MSKKLKITFLIVCGAAVLFFLFFRSGNKIKPTEGNLSSSSGIDNGIVVDENENNDTAFLNTLDYIKSMQIDPSIFLSSSFKSLEDNTVIIDSNRIIGRTNPFSSIGGVPQNLVVVPAVNEEGEEKPVVNN